MEGSSNFGPIPPPEAVTGLKTDNKDESELKQSIKKKGQNSYYYAHNYDGQNFNNENAKQFYGDGLIYGGEPTLISKKEKTEGEEVKKQVSNPVQKIKKYSWLDEDTKVKIYIELDQFPTKITKSMIDIKFEEYSVDIKVVDEAGTEHVLGLSKLFEKIEEADSLWKFSEKRISITLKKWLETKWNSLLKAK